HDVTLLPVDKVDWMTAATPAAGLNQRSDFMRAQHLMAQLAAASYEGQAGFDAIAGPLGFIGAHVHGETGIFGATKPDAYVGIGGALRMSFVAIRGTEDGNDWLTDFFHAPT